MDIYVPAFSRRRFLRTLGRGMLLAALPGPVWAAEMNALTISIFHTTDLHGHILPTTDYAGHPDLGGLARCATQIRAWRAAQPNSLLLDIGDIYEGTEFGLLSRGQTMMRCLNALGYDAWVVGNHEFDWGLEAFAEAVGRSSMPVLSGNAMLDGVRAGRMADGAGPLAKLRPYLLREVAGIRLAMVSLTTPALAQWLPPEDLGGFEVTDPAEALRAMWPEIEAQRPDAIVLAGHMGLKRRDDFANRIGELTRDFPQVAVCLGAHTHQNHPADTVNGVLYTQADHYGIYVGRVDLTFDRATRRLIRREATTVPMDHGVEMDPLVLSLARGDLQAGDAVLARPMGELTEPFDATPVLGRPSDVERLIGSGIVAALRAAGVEVDAVVHGLFSNESLAVGRKTVGDAWSVVPYENEVVTIEIGRDDLLALVRDLGAGREFRNIMGVRVMRTGDGSVGSISPEKTMYRIALNSFDSQSAGGRFPVMARLVASPASRRQLHAIQVRDALVDFFVTRGRVGKSSLLV